MNNTKAFTLIELLVVVLIIGILAAVALPQYQKAVEKARMSEGIMLVESIAKANQLYKMSSGSYTQDINDLDIEYPGTSAAYCGTIPSKYTKYFELTASNCVGEQSLIAVAQRMPSATKYALTIYFSGARSCVFYAKASTYERQLCQAWAAGQ